MRGISIADYRSLTRKQLSPARQQDRTGHLPARLNLQDDHRARRSRSRRLIGTEETQSGAPAILRCRQPQVPLLEARRTRAWWIWKTVAQTQSCDVYYYDLALCKVGHRQDFGHGSKRFGLGVQTRPAHVRRCRAGWPRISAWKAADSSRSGLAGRATRPMPRSGKATCWHRRMQLAVMSARTGDRPQP